MKGIVYVFSALIITLNLSCSGTFKDVRDGKKYKTVKIGNQIWMAENLSYLPSVVGFRTFSETTPCYYVYGYDGTNLESAKTTVNYSTFGVLYNWPAAVEACPDGWHLPSDSEWTQLTDYLGGVDIDIGTDFIQKVAIAGGKLKETGTLHWKESNADATNESGFTALPGGLPLHFGWFGIGYVGYWWSATNHDTDYAWLRYMDSEFSYVYKHNLEKDLGCSVRCVRD